MPDTLRQILPCASSRPRLPILFFLNIGGLERLGTLRIEVIANPKPTAEARQEGIHAGQLK
jgi:hypothetical protein